MTRELEAFNKIKKFKDDCCMFGSSDIEIDRELSIIETALKEKEQQDNVLKTLKEVIEFAQMLPHIEPNKDHVFDIVSAVGMNIQRDIENEERKQLREWILNTCFPKELKALQIIKEKKVNVGDIFATVNYADYKRMCDEWKQPLPQEEYDILKEVLK